MKEFLKDVKAIWPDMSLVEKAKFASQCAIVGSLAVMSVIGIAGSVILMINEVK